MRKVYKKLTEDQKLRGVIFSSCLSVYNTEQSKDTIHEVYKDDDDKDIVIERLLNDKFFNNSHFKVNIIRR
jgi:hypothetical protein